VLASYLAPRAAPHLLVDVSPHSNLFVGNNRDMGMEGWAAVGRALSSTTKLRQFNLGNERGNEELDLCCYFWVESFALSFSTSFFPPFPQLLLTL
jgi:hypothetical protein